MRASFVVLCLAGCVSPVMTFGAGKSPKQAQRDTMNEFGPSRLVTNKTWTGDVSTVKVRVWADSQYRAQNIHWQQTFDESLELANVVIEPTFGVHLVAQYESWDRNVAGATLTDDIAALHERDDGDGVFAVIGLTSSLPLVSSTFEELGLASLGGRHVMLRGYADLEERKMYANAFPDLRPEERELALVQLRQHKTAVVLLHELGHVLGVGHEIDASTIMNATYSNHASAFSAHAREVMLRSFDERLDRQSTAPAVAFTEPAASHPQVVPASATRPTTEAAPPATQAAPAVHHEPVVIRVTRKRATIVDGKVLGPAELDALLKPIVAEDPKTKIVVSEDRNVPDGAVSDVIDRVKALGFTKFELAWTGK